MPAFIPTSAAGVDPSLFALALMLALATAAAAAFGGHVLRQHRRETRHLGLIAGLRDEIADLKGTVAARDRAEAASEAKSRFLATVSHEVRTPLNGILGMADLLSGTPLSAEQKSYLDSIRTSGQALASLIDEILDFSRIEAGRLELERKPFDLHGLVEGVVELLAPRAQGKGLEIASSIAADAPQQVAGDAQRLRQVLLNLAGNAVKFTETGGVGVRVTRDGAGRLRFSVVDTGPGVPLAQRETIFAEFEQGDNVGALGGAGLGLAISSRLVAAMGGTLRLDSPPGGGAVFSFAITLPDAGPAASRPSALGQLVGRRALIIAQSPFEAPWLGERLADAGAQVRTIAGEAAALDALGDLAGEGPAPDIVIVDCALGAEAAARLAAAARAAGVARSLVLFSPFERRALGEQATQGFDGWLTKPVRRHSLLARLEESIAAENAWRDPVEAPPRPGEGLSVLIAEDNDINAVVATRQIEKMGARVTRVVDGLQAVDAAAQARARGAAYDVIFMDIRMPNLDGLEAARRIRLAETETGARPCRIVALTANAFADDHDAALSAGMDEALTKPVDPARIGAELAAARRPPPQTETTAQAQPS
jgi:signal transduction histidine kinase/CheY-like chemotaxis protein